MHSSKWLFALAALIAVGLLTGCGGDDNSSSTAASSDTSSTSSTTEGSTPDDVYNACIDAISGTAAEDSAKPACEQARNAFEQCMTQAQNIGGSAGDTAVQACQDAADQTVAGLQSAP
jgi:hypothetical protein